MLWMKTELVGLHPLTMRCDCLYGFSLASDVPYGQSSIWMTANELFSLMMPGNWVDSLRNYRQKGRENGGGQGKVVEQDKNIMCHHVPYATRLLQCWSHTVHVTCKWFKSLWLCVHGQMVDVRKKECLDFWIVIMVCYSQKSILRAISWSWWNDQDMGL